MKIIIVCYSYGGNTKRASLFLKEALTVGHHSVDILDLRPVEEASSFFRQCFEALFHKKPTLHSPAHDVEDYDLVIFASPVWAFTFAPAIRSFLKKLKHLEDKKVICFVTFGSGLGAVRTLRELEEAVRQKKGKILYSKSISGPHSKSRPYLEQEFKPLLAAIDAQ